MQIKERSAADRPSLHFCLFVYKRFICVYAQKTAHMVQHAATYGGAAGRRCWLAAGGGVLDGAAKGEEGVNEGKEGRDAYNERRVGNEG